MERHGERMAIYKPRRGVPGEPAFANTLIWAFQSPELRERNMCCLSPPGNGILLWEPEHTNTGA